MLEATAPPVGGCRGAQTQDGVDKKLTATSGWFFGGLAAWRETSPCGRRPRVTLRIIDDDGRRVSGFDAAVFADATPALPG